MLNTIKKQINKTFATCFVIGLIAAVAFLALTKFGYFKILKGAEPLDGRALKSIEGEYVTAEIKYPLEIYEEDYSKNTKTGETRTTHYGYVVYDEDSQEFFGVIVSKSRYDEIEKVLEEFYALEDEDDEMTSSFTVTGTVKKMDSQSLSFYNQTMSYLFTDYEYASEAWYIDDETVNGDHYSSVYLLSILALIAVVIAIINLIFIFTGKYKSGVDKYLKKNPQTSLNELDSEFSMAVQAYKKGWVGMQHIFVITGSRVEILDNKDLVWCYYYHRSGRYSVSQLRCFTVNKKMIALDMSKSDAMAMMECMESRLTHVLLGYDAEYEKMYKKDFQGFLNIRYNVGQNQDANQYGNDPYEGNGAY